MRKSMKEAIGATVRDMLNSDLKTSFTKKDFDELGVEFSEIKITSNDIRAIRRKTKLSQAVFAKLLNVSPSSVRQWEQGKRTPTGSTKVLLDLLEKSPHVLDYRIKA
ncbi:MAG: helix-turn-helix domain-containing protein [Candidatus Sabulitectum sp.]|nr:helix-turn-helix domain-containing protein [Candidatus Sabulitectum sp.]